MLGIVNEYQQAMNLPKIKRSQVSGGGMGGQDMLAMKEYFYDYLKNKIPSNKKTESMIEYMGYLKNEITSMKKYSSKPEHYMLNLIFSFFPKGFDFHFDYENLECVTYDSENLVSAKIAVPTNEVDFSINKKKIGVKVLDFDVEVSDLNKCESILDGLKNLSSEKMKIAELVLEPCYSEIKKQMGYDPEENAKRKNEEITQKLKNSKGNIFSDHYNKRTQDEYYKKIKNENLYPEDETSMSNNNSSYNLLKNKVNNDLINSPMLRNPQNSKISLDKHPNNNSGGRINKGNINIYNPNENHLRNNNSFNSNNQRNYNNSNKSNSNIRKIKPQNISTNNRYYNNNNFNNRYNYKISNSNNIYGNNSFGGNRSNGQH